ncbi:MAG TPA: ABC transporter substrate-binding protein [Gaiellaceae bacterium]|nr:ABC transporter substrate-binding protein [Gaiellaceae bacterium]
MHRLTIAVLAAFAVALTLVSLSAAAHRRTRQAQGFPHRIVSLSPTITEDLFAIGAGKQVVAVDEDSNFPRRAPRTKLSGVTPNVEAIAKYHPDLVFISYNPGNFASQLRKLGIKVVDEPAVNDIGHAYKEILGLGRLTGHVKGAGAVVTSMRTKLAAIVRSVPASRRHLRVYHELEQDYFSATSKTFIGSIYRLFGFRDIADGADSAGTGYPQLSAEYIIAQNPQIIVLADTKCCQQTEATVAARPGWSTITAVRRGRVVGIDDDVASRWGPRIVQFARAVARIARHG